MPAWLRLYFTRLKRLEKFLEEDKNDPFNWYALTNEYLAFDSEKALSQFLEVMTKFPDYLATYYPAAKLLVEFEQEEKALIVYQNGIVLAKTQGNQKTLNELNSAY
ncbi:MAG: tetratricopeptide (TPR) repeat protein [Roseivirga sp.]|jgi:tetratricopeptide (TPR) repeat protein